MIKLFKKRGGKKIKGIEYALKKLIGKKFVRQVLLTCPDKRELAANTALSLSLDEEALIRESAAILGIPYCQQVAPFNIELLPKWLPFYLLRQAGAAPLFVENAQLQGFICADPELLFNVIPPSRRYFTYLASWRTIFNALNLAEKAYLKRQEEAKKEREKEAEKKAEKAFYLIVEEALKHKCEKIQLALSEDRSEFVLYLAEDKKAIGRINPVVRERLLNFCFKKTTENNGKIYKDNYLIEVKADSRRGINKCEDIFICIKKDKQEEENKKREERKNVIVLSSNGAQKNGNGYAKIPEAEKESRRLNVITQAFSPRVVIVDDNPTFSKVLKRFLERENISCVVYNNSLEALQVLLRGKTIPSLIICDLHMPEVNGFEFVKRLRKSVNPLIRQVNVLILTSDEDIEAELQGFNDGVDDFIRKDIDPRILSARVKRFLSKMEREKAGVL